MKTSTLLFAILFSIFSSSAQAVLRTSNILGASIISHPIRHRRDEICAIPLHLPGAKYAKKDFEHETELCSYVIEENVAACPKRRSTNPAIELFTPPAGMSVKELSRKSCLAVGAKKQAKYKVSVSCSYTPSPLAYYHVSRAIGNVANVPPVVLKTYDLEAHQDMANRALSLLRNRSDSQIYRWWNVLNEALHGGPRGEHAYNIFTDDYTQTFGSLQRNPRGEKEYNEFNGAYGTDRMTWFKYTNPIYVSLTRTQMRIGREFTQANVLAMRQLKDTADFILLDTLLNQQDRFGNMHSKEKFYYLAQNEGKIELLKADSFPEVPEAYRKTAVKVKELVLKDNDCGVNMEPRIKKARLLDSVAHIDPETYKYFLAFAATYEKPETHDFFVRGLQFTENNFRKVGQNIKEAAAMLRANCSSGKLALDLDLKAHFTGQPLPASYSCEN